MKNLFTNLMNWMMGSEMSKVVHEPAGSTTIAESPRNIPLITPLSPPNHPLLCRFRSIKTSLRFLRYVAMIFAVLVMSMANIGMAWGVDFTAAQISSGTTSGNISVSTAGLSNNQSKNVCSGTKMNSVSANSGAGATFSGKYIEIKASSGYSISTLNLLVRSNNSSACNGAVVFWNGDASATCNSYDTFSALAYNTSDCDGTVSITVPSNTRTIRIYRGPKINPSTKAFDSGSSEIGGTSTFNVFSVSATVTAACTEIHPSLSYTSTSLMVGDNSSAPTLNKDGSAGAVTWTSSNTDVATVNSSGVVTAEGAGTATITASIAANGGKCEGSATENFTVTADPLGSHTLTWNITTVSGSSESNVSGGTTDIGTTSTASTSTYLTSLTDLAGVGVKRTTTGKNSNTGKIETPSSYDADKYVTMTFAVASGYQFTPSSVSIKTVAVTTTKDLKFEFSDANGSYSVTKTSLSTSGTAATNTLDFSGCDRAFTGIVTVKIYVYGATDQYRLSTPLTIDGTVAAAAACTAPTSPSISGTTAYTEGQNISLTASATGTDGSTTYTWYKGADWATASATTPVQAASTSGATFTKASCVVGDAGTYWCNISNGTGCEVQTSTTITVVAPACDWNINYITNGLKDNNPSAVWSENNCFTQVGSTNEWILENFEMPDVAGQFWVGPGSFVGHSVVADLSTIKWVYRSDKSRTSKSAVTNMTGTLNIWSDSGDDNYYTGIYPDYQITYGVDGSGGWTKVDFNHVSGTEYRTAIVTAPSGYKNNDNFKYYVGLRTKDNGNTYWGDRSNTVKMNGMSGMSSTDQAGKKGQWKMYEDSGSDNYYCSWIPVYTLTYNANGGSGAPAAQEVISDAVPCQWTLSTTQPTWADHVFLGWSTNSSASVPDAASEVADLGTPYSATGDVTLYAVWTACTGPTINSFVPTGVTDGTYPVGTALGSLTVTASAGNGGTLSYLWYQYDGGNIGAAVAAAGTNNTATYNIPNNATCVERHYYCVVSEEGCSTTRTSAISGALTLTAPTLVAIEANTLYQASNMLCSGMSPLTGDDKYFTDDAFSTDYRFYYDVSSGNGPKTHTIASTTLGSGQSYAATFTTEIWVKGTASLTDGIPGAPSIKFLTPSSGGTLYLYIESSSCPIKFKKSNGSASNITSLTQIVSGKIYSTEVDANSVYYIYGNGTSNTGFYGLKLITCSTPDAPTAFSAGSITSTGVTFSITDAGNAASYDIYYSTSSTAPTAGTAATTTSDAKTKAVTGLAASTTYYAWVRSVCDASHKSAWVALSGSTFTTSEEAVLTAMECNTLYKVEDMVPSSITLSTTGQYGAGLSTNTKFEVLGDPSETDQAGGTPEMKNESSTTIDGTSFTGRMYLKGASNTTGSGTTFVPTSRAIKFIIPSSGTLDIYAHRVDRLYLKKAGDSGTTQLGTSTSGTGSKVTHDVTAGTYYIYATNNGTCIYGIKLNCCSDPVINEGTTKTSFAGGSWPQNSGHTITITATGADSYEWYRNTSATDAGATKLSETSNTLDITAGVAAGTYFYKAIAKSGACSSSTEWGWCGAMTITAVTYSITYNCNGAESGCPSNVAAASNLPSPLPTGLTKDGYDFGGWFTDSECTVAAVAGAALTGNTDLYAKWTVHSASECITIAYFETTSHNNSSSKPDNAGKYIYGYTNSAKTEAYAYTITSSTGDNKGQGTGESDYLRMNYGTTVTIYADNTTTGGTPASFSNVTSVSVDFKMMKSTYYTSFDIYVGSTKIASNVSLEGAAQSAFTTFTYDNLEQLSGTVRIVNKGSGSSNFHFYVDNIVICTASMSSCTTPTLPSATLSNQTVCEGSDIAAWDATPTNASTITGKGESIAYSWKKKGNDTELATTATFDLGSSAAESQAGTYVVTLIVSKAGYASSSANKEVELTVTEGEEVTSIVADKATVYPGNSVTLTATANTPATWQWYTCTSAEGAGAAIISGATSASYTIASAGAAGTYYYKAEATGDCGTAEAVYTLTVSEAAGGDCETEIWVVKAADLPEGATAATHITTPFSGGSNETASITIDGNIYTITQRTSNATGPATIVVPDGNTATLYILVKGNGGRSVILEKGGVQQWTETPEDGWQALSVDNLDAGTYSLRSSNNLGWGLLALKLCSAVACSDPEVTASADNTTVCVGTSVTFTASDAHASATYQWQKLDGTWTNISGATASTYNIASVVAGDAGKYRVIASHDCNRTSNEVTLSVPSAPDFGSTVPASVSVMQTIALSINTVEATDAVKYRWYKSADPTWDAGDVEIGTNKELIKAYDSEAIGSPSYYIFCRAQNACGITTSTAIAVNVTAYVEEDCATRGNEGLAEFSFENSGCGQGSYQSTACWTMNSNSKILVYYPPTGKYFKTAKVTIASSSENKASYNWSTNGGTSFTAVRLDISTTLTERTIDLSAHGNVDAFQIGRNFNSTGESSGTLYVSKICFEYTDACTATTVTPSTESTSYEMGGEWTDPTFTLTPAAVSGGTLTYSSSNEDIASVDDDGTVTFNGDAGTVTITASYAGGTISATDYCASSGSYTITVSCTGGAPKVVVDGSVDMSGCNSSVTLHAKKQDGTAFADGTYQWFRNGTEIDGATSSSYTATQAGTYTVERTNTSDCTTPSTNSVVITSETTEPEVERLVPFQYYHVDKAYSDQMKMRHLFAVKNSGKLDGKSFKMYVSRNGAAATDVTSSNALVVVPNADGHVDTVMVDLNKLSGKYSEDDELVFTCKAIDCESNVSEVYKNTITMNVIDETPTLALICSGSSKAGGTRKTGELTVGGDFLTGYNVADLCQQTGNTSFDANTEWGLYTDLKTQYIVTPVNGYAVFNKLNYEPFDILLLTDYPKASKSDAAKDVLDDMAALCDYRPMLSFKTHMVAKSPSKWAEKGFTTSPVVTKADGKLNLNIVCYAHPMFEGLKSGDDVYTDVGNTSAPLVYTMLTGTGYESGKGMQGFELAAAENFVTIGLTHYNGTIAKDSPDPGEVEWTPGPEDRMLVTVAERQANPEARFILFSLNCGAQSKLTERGEQVILACLEYLLGTAEGTIEPADCSFTFDNGENNEHNDAWYASNCPLCTGTKGDGLWTTAANWGPDYRLLPGEFTSVRIKKPVEVNDEHAHVMEVRIIDEGSIDIPAGKALDVKSTIRRMDGSEIYPTEENDIHIGSAYTGNGTLIFNNDEGDTKARVDMYSKGFIDGEGVKNYQYMGTPFIEVNALYNYYGSWIYSWGEKKNGSIGWVAVKNGGPMSAWTGYCITQEGPTTHAMSGTLTATGSVDIPVPANENWVVGNSWTAPIDINALTTDDLEGLVANIYFFNTGVDKKGTAGEAGSRYAGGTYVTVPIHSAPYATEDDHINSMQGFFVKNTSGSAGALHLDYERHVRGTTRSSIIGDALHAPKRAQDADTDEPAVLKMKVCGENYDDKLLLLEREDFSTGFDNGWDGDKWDGNESALYLYTTDSEGTEYSVSAIPEMEGTVIGFRAGEDEAYTLKFEYLNGDETLYLFDIENNTYTEIKTGATYRFFTNDKEKHQRFVLTRKNPNVATEIDNVQSDKVQGSKVQKLLIEDKLFILRNGMLYDATGKVVK